MPRNKVCAPGTSERVCDEIELTESPMCIGYHSHLEMATIFAILTHSAQCVPYIDMKSLSGDISSYIAELGRSRHVAGIRLFSLRVSEATRWIIVDLALKDGVSGYGEATDHKQPERVLEALEALRPAAVSDVTSLLAALDARIGGGHAEAAARSALEQAALDALARSCALSLADLLGGARRERIAVYANVNRGAHDRSPEGIARAAARAVAEGYRAVKIAPFDEVQPRQPSSDALDAGIARIHALRAAIGRDVALRVDCHFRLALGAAETVLRETSGADLDWIEDVLDPRLHAAADRREFRNRANAGGVRVAGGENLISQDEARHLLEDAALDVILPDLRLTGVRNGLTILDLAGSAGVETSLHSPVSPVLDATSLQVGAAAWRFATLERQINETPLYCQLASVPPVGEDGKVVLPLGSGTAVRPVIEMMQPEPEHAA